MTRLAFIFSFAALCGLLVGPTSGNVIVEQSQGYGQDQTDITGGSFDFQSASDNVFVVTVFQFDNGSSDIRTPSVTLDPDGNAISLTALQSAQSGNNSDLNAHLFAAALGNVTAGSQDFAISGEGSFGAVAYQLSNALQDVSAAITGGNGVKDQPIDLTGITPGSVGIDLQADGSNTPASASGTFNDDTPNPFTSFIATGNRGLASGAYTGQSGDEQLGYDGSAAQVRVGGAFAPIPEPASLALLGMGGLLIAGRRR